MDVDALLVVSFGGPEGLGDVMPFLRRVTAGRGIPDERLAQVAEQYRHFGGVSPINAQNRDLVARLRAQAPDAWVGEKVYLGNRNSEPFLPGTVARMAADGVGRAAVFITSAFSSYSGCRQYRENLAAAQAEAGTSIGWAVLPRFHDHPVFTDIWADRLRQAAPGPGDLVVFVTHSLPINAASRYLPQHQSVARALVEMVAPDGLDWRLAFQSRSGAPGPPWLEPDIAEVLTRAGAEGYQRAIVAPIGFCSENLEIGWDLDVTAAQAARDAGVQMVRLPTPQSDPRFTKLVWQLQAGDVNTCAVDCCVNPRGKRPAIGDRVADRSPR